MRVSAAIDATTTPNLTIRAGRLLSRLKEHPLARLGPGLITGVTDDDPSGIATYSQAGAQFGLNMLWTMPVAFPLMAAIQLMCARIGRVTGKRPSGEYRGRVFSGGASDCGPPAVNRQYSHCCRYRGHGRSRRTRYRAEFVTL